MSEYSLDSGHHVMRSCDSCDGAFHCWDRPDDMDEDASAPDWTCETCTAKDAQIKALADALWDARQYGDGPGELCWDMSPCSPGKQRIRCRAAEHALRIVGRLS